MVDRWWHQLEQPQRLIEQRARVRRRPLKSEHGRAQVHGRRHGRVRMVGEAAVRLVGKHTATGYVADCPERVKAPHVHVRQVHPGELLRAGHANSSMARCQCRTASA